MGRCAYGRRVHRFPPLSVRAEQGTIADRVDQPWHTARQAIDLTDRVGLEEVPASPGLSQPVGHIGERIVLGEGQQIVPSGDVR